MLLFDFVENPLPFVFEERFVVDSSCSRPSLASIDVISVIQVTFIHLQTCIYIYLVSSVYIFGEGYRTQLCIIDTFSSD